MTSPAFLHIGVLRAASRVMLAATLPALGACTSTILSQSSFNSQQIDAPPAATQLVGTMQVISGDTGRIRVEAGGGGTGPRENVLRISRAIPVPNGNPATPASVVQGTLAQTFPDGNYGFLGVFEIGQGSGLASLDFVANPQGPVAESFLHLDFMPDGSVRFDDDPSATCCHYPDAPFTLSVSIQVTASSAVAHVTLFGKGVSQGTYDYTIKQPNLARQFRAFRLSMGFPWAGDFYVTDLVLTRHN